MSSDRTLQASISGKSGYFTAKLFYTWSSNNTGGYSMKIEKIQVTDAIANAGNVGSFTVQVQAKIGSTVKWTYKLNKKDYPFGTSYSAGKTLTYTPGSTYNIPNTHSAQTVAMVWTAIADYSGGSTASTTQNSSVSVPAKASYTVAYAANGGSSTPGSQTKWYNEALTLSGAISKAATSPGNYTVTLNGNGGSNLTALTSKRTVTYSFYRWKATNGTLYTASASYTANAGTTMTAQWTTNAETRAAVTLPSHSRSGFTWVRWNTNSSNTGTGYNSGSSYTPSGNVILYAIWNRTITYNANGGSGAPGNQTALATSAITIGAAPSFSGYSFNRWNTKTDNTGTGYAPGGSYAAQQPNVTLYAIWNRTITYNGNGSGAANVPASQTSVKTSPITLSTTRPTRSGYTFLGWSDVDTGAKKDAYDPGKTYAANQPNKTLYAVWAPAISGLTVSRTDANGTADVIEGHVKVDFAVSNQASYVVSVGSYSQTYTDSTSGAKSLVLPVNADPETAYSVAVTVTGSNGQSTSASYTLPKSSYTKPVISSILTERVNQNNIYDDEGEFVRVTVGWSTYAAPSQVAQMTVAAVDEDGESVNLLGCQPVIPSGVLSDDEFIFYLPPANGGYTYELTQDEEVNLSKNYFSRSGSGTEADPYVYTEVELPRFVYSLTSDTAVDLSKIYYVLSGGDYIDVDNPVDADIATYYERSLNNPKNLYYVRFMAEGLFDVEKNYVITVTVSDAAGRSTPRSDTLSKAFYSMDVIGDSRYYEPSSDTVIDASKVYYALEDSSAVGSDAFSVVLKPNLTPWFSVSVSDTSYWQSLHARNASVSNAEGLHAAYDDTDGWAHITLDSRSSAGNTGGSCYMNMWVAVGKIQSAVKPGGTYTWMIEVSNLTFIGADESSALSVKPSVGNETLDIFSDCVKRFTENGIDYATVTAKSSFSSLTQDVRGYCYIPTGCYADFKLRVSLYEGEYSEAYKPYTAPSSANWHEKTGPRPGHGVAFGMPAQQEGMHLGFPLTIHNNTAVSRQAFIENDIPGTDTYLTARNLISGTSVAFGIGSGYINHGIWSDTLNRWMIYSNGSNTYMHGTMLEITNNGANVNGQITAKQSFKLYSTVCNDASVQSSWTAVTGRYDYDKVGNQVGYSEIARETNKVYRSFAVQNPKINKTTSIYLNQNDDGTSTIGVTGGTYLDGQARYVRDSNNGNSISIRYAGAGVTSASWACVYDGYNIVPISIKSRSGAGTLDWGNSDQHQIVDKSCLAFWNGAYSGTSSNLAYCNQGAFGGLAAKSSVALSITTKDGSVKYGSQIANNGYAQFDVVIASPANTVLVGVTCITFSGTNAHWLDCRSFDVDGYGTGGSNTIKVFAHNRGSALAANTITCYVQIVCVQRQSIS